ncbi:ABC transporter permease [Fervidobacterium thailandense]|uniref:ABC transporter permease n=1 Tax=Fervidobacterium thailandense TaxID=1008305 RepID=A0A1E3G1B8_9BACT|nr:ABC transporter permease subunit [Fervidobacterium thailandense]ODN30025.1 ABC transporter permease [Fervidobacterium thailandense]
MRKELYDLKVRLFGTLIVCIALFFIVAPFQKFSVSLLEGYEGTPGTSKIMEKLIPRGFIERLKEWNFYINSQWFGKNFGQLVPIIGIILGFPLFAREIEKGTIQFILVRRSRRWIFTNKIIAGFIALLVIITISTLLPSIYSIVTEKEYNHQVIPHFLIHTLFASILWYSISVFFSVITDDQVKPLLASLGLLAVTTVLGLLKPLKFLNTFNYALGTDVFRTGKANATYTIWIAILSVIILLSAMKIFEKREF